MNNVKKAGLLSTLFMGLGQFYNREWLKGAIFSIIEAITLFYVVNGTIFDRIKGIITLGSVKGVKGDHSLNLLINGILTLILLSFALIAYYINIRDARDIRKEIEQGKEPKTSLGFIKHVWTEYFPFALMSPGVVLITFFTFLPIVFTMLIAFTNYSAPYHLPPGNLVDWVGLKNFINLIRMDGWSDTFFAIALWTVIWAVLTTFINYFGGLGLALLINAKGLKFKKLWRTLFIIPYAIPGFISLLIFRLILSGPGPINTLLVSSGLISTKIPFLTDPTMAKIMVIMVYLWNGSPYWMAMMSGVLTNIDKGLYEAANIDGATNWQQFTKITVPMVLFQTAPLLIMTFAHNFNNFGSIYLLTDGNPANPLYKQAGDTDILISWIYKMTLEKQWYSMAAAVSILIFLVIATFSVFGFIRTSSFKEGDMI